MIEIVLTALIFLAAIGSALMAGTFFAFSSFVMKALDRLPAPQGIAAMQSINVVVLNPVFLTVFSGTAVLCCLLAVATVFRWDQANAIYLLSGSLLYIAGTFGVTVAFNVPLNNRLAAVAAASNDGADLWRFYLQRWSLWNHVRTAAAIASFACFLIAFQ